MAIEIKGGVLKAVEEGKAVVRLATLLKVDQGNDVVEHGFFPTAPPLKVSIQPYHNHVVPSQGHATVWEDTAKGEILAHFEFNDSLAAQEQWRVIRWDFEHGSIQEFSWAFRPKPGAARHGTFEGKSVRFLGKASDGEFGVDLIEAGPVLRAASINTGTLDVRSSPSGDGAPLSRADNAKFTALAHQLNRRIADRTWEEQSQFRQLHLSFLKRSLEIAQGRKS